MFLYLSKLDEVVTNVRELKIPFVRPESDGYIRFLYLLILIGDSSSRYTEY